MDQRFKQRLIGAIVLVALAIIFVPMLLSGPVQQTRVDIELDMPDAPEREEVPALPEADLLEDPPEAPSEAPPEELPEDAAPEDVVTSEPAPEADESVPEAEPAFFVQVGAFGSRENAEGLAARLRDDGFGMRLVEEGGDGQVSYRVQAGPYDDRAEAEEQAQALADQHELPGFIIEP
ncbi:MAG: SPOR domain-containing protein [Spiribacter sp.]|nr:SPOR domain-containing protein [Spiribacter sp.]